MTPNKKARPWLYFSPSLMKTFSVGPTPSTVEVYVHNYHEHFEKTLERMTISNRIKAVHTTATKNIKQAMEKYKEKVAVIEKQYLNLLMNNNLPLEVAKERYKRLYIQNVEKGDTPISKTINMFTQMSPDTVRSLKKTIEKYTGTTKPLTKKQALSQMLFYSQDAIKKIGDLINAIDEERMRASHKDFSETNIEAVQKRKKHIENLSALIAKDDQGLAKELKEVDTIGDLQKIIGKIRKRYLGEVFEPLVGLYLNDFQRMMARGMVEITGKKIPGVSYTLVGDIRGELKDSVYTTDVITKMGTMKIGVDVKSGSHLYSKSTQSVGSQYKLIANILLDNTQFKEFFGNLNTSDPDLLKEIAYILVNMTVFQQADVGLEQSENIVEIEKGLKFLTMLTGIMDFLMEYVKTFDNIYRKQILIIAGKDVFFLTDLIDMLISMVQQLKFGSGSLFGGFTEYKAETTGRIDLNAHKHLLKEKREVMAKDKIKYAALLSHLRGGTMKKIAQTALERTTKVRISFNPSQQFKKVGSIK
jgi:hypothetical protein